MCDLYCIYIYTAHLTVDRICSYSRPPPTTATTHYPHPLRPDAKPKVLFKQNSYEGTVKLTDFGLSKAVDNRDLDKVSEYR
jgi:hypothetical protein